MHCSSLSVTVATSLPSRLWNNREWLDPRNSRPDPLGSPWGNRFATRPKSAGTAADCCRERWRVGGRCANVPRIRHIGTDRTSRALQKSSAYGWKGVGRTGFEPVTHGLKAALGQIPTKTTKRDSNLIKNLAHAHRGAPWPGAMARRSSAPKTRRHGAPRR